MEPPELRISVNEHPDETLIRLSGRMDVVTCHSFRDTMIRLTAKEWKNIVLDLRALHYIDSFAFGCLLHWREKAAENRRSIILANCSGAVRDAVRLIGFHTLFEMR